jgi:hypothetical protein
MLAGVPFRVQGFPDCGRALGRLDCDFLSIPGNVVLGNNVPGLTTELGAMGKHRS